MKFTLSGKFKPAGDQPKAIEELVKGLKKGEKFQTLLGVTGSGKTFTIANVIEKLQKPTLVIAPNKTLAAQLAQEFRTFFPKNAVEYFVSYYDYYQPEAYIPSTDTYIEKETQINEEIDRLRHAATAALMSRNDVIIVASVSCIYGLGSPEFYKEITLELKTGEEINREEVIRKLVDMQYHRGDILARGRFRVTGETLEIMPPAKEIVTRIELEGKKVKKIFEYDFLTGEELGRMEKTYIYPARHFVVPEPIMESALGLIENELDHRVNFLREAGKMLEAERLRRRTRHDLEMMREVGYCNGIENYSRYFTGRKPGEAPYTLIDYFPARYPAMRDSDAGGPSDFLMVVDESHVTIPQLRGMYYGDYSRKQTLIENGFRLPSALDNRPLKFLEFEKKISQLVFTSATPGDYERKNSSRITEQVIRPTGLLDPQVEVRPAKGQVKDVILELQKIHQKGERALLTTLTKKMAEDLSEFLKESEIHPPTNSRDNEDLNKNNLSSRKLSSKPNTDSEVGGGIKAEYLHSEVDTLERVRILEDLRRGKFEVLVGVNLLREGLDLPEVTLVAIFDADKEGFLRSETSLIQTIGRAARNVSGRVILYADKITGSMKRAISETNRRRALQMKYNKKHHITPKTIEKNIKSIVDHEINPIPVIREAFELESMEDLHGYIKQREKEMKEAARNLEFEKAAIIRDEILQLRRMQKS